MRLQDRVVLITGGAAGIGKATAQRFKEEGAIVAICDVNEEAGQATATELDIRFDKVDTANKEQVDNWLASVHEAHGRIDVLINNAGILRDGQMVKFKNGEITGEMSEAQFDSVINVNLKGVFICAQAAAKYMIPQGSGVILNASSIVGLDGNFGQTNYVATKSGVVGMTKVWARELGRYGIRVNAIAPGFIMTEMVAQMPEKILDGMRAHTPLHRLGNPRDIANAYLFLASDEASFVSGTVLRVDGGILVGT
ncbi:MAG TPA: glucose 1-dehydrogenase [Anaerolineae bacterium]|nr:glucose 1-dehydrogenase [Anaerolineae bacterium]